jgi:hypothetical protein
LTCCYLASDQTVNSFVRRDDNSPHKRRRVYESYVKSWKILSRTCGFVASLEAAVYENAVYQACGQYENHDADVNAQVHYLVGRRRDAICCGRIIALLCKKAR